MTPEYRYRFAGRKTAVVFILFLLCIVGFLVYPPTRALTLLILPIGVAGDDIAVIVFICVLLIIVLLSAVFSSENFIFRIFKLLFLKKVPKEKIKPKRRSYPQDELVEIYPEKDK